MEVFPLPTEQRPVYVNRIDGLNIYPGGISRVDISYTRNPARPQWGYVVIDEKALYDDDPLKTTHFELHASEESELVYKILKFAGVGMKREDLAQTTTSNCSSAFPTICCLAAT